jgi:hypothetical protein
MITTAALGGGITSRRGTSFAAPFVTGAAVLAQQLAEQEMDRRLTPAEFRERLQSSGALINDGDDENDNVQNTGADYRRLDIFALGESLLQNPGLPSLAISDLTVTEGDSGSTLASVIVQISRAPHTAVTVEFAVADGTATLADNDFQATTGTLTFSPTGPLTQTIQVPIVGDVRHEPTETFRVLLSNAIGATLIDPLGIVTILDNDLPLPWRNPVNPYDVNDNGFVTGLDALIIINKLNTTGPQVLPEPPAGPHPFYDVSGDNRVTAIDALIVINELNRAAAARQASQTTSESPTLSPTPGASTASEAAAAAGASLAAAAAVEFDRHVSGDPATLLDDAPMPIAKAAIATDPTLFTASQANALSVSRGVQSAMRQAWQLYWAEYDALCADTDVRRPFRKWR